MIKHLILMAFSFFFFALKGQSQTYSQNDSVLMQYINYLRFCGENPLFGITLLGKYPDEPNDIFYLRHVSSCYSIQEEALYNKYELQGHIFLWLDESFQADVFQARETITGLEVISYLEQKWPNSICWDLADVGPLVVMSEQEGSLYIGFSISYSEFIRGRYAIFPYEEYQSEITKKLIIKEE